MMHEIVLNGYTAQHSSNRCLSLGTAESYGIEKIHITAGPGWEDMVIKAVFHPPSGEAVTALIGEDGVIEVPPEATAVPAGEYNPGVIVFSGVSEGVQRISANLAYTVIGHAPVDGKDSEPTPSQWEQLVARYQSKVDKQQGSENAGKVLGIGEDGLVMPVEQTGGGDITDEIKQEIAQEAAGMIDIPKPLLVVTITDGGTASHSSEEIIKFAQTGEVVFMAEGIRATLVGFYGQVCAFIMPATTEAPAVQIAIAGTNISVQDVPNYFPETLPNPKPLKFSGAVSGSYDGSSEFNLNIPAIPTIPDKLPNPNALTFTGAVEETYDGSAPMTVEIPEGSSSDIVFEDSYVSNANNWVTNGYTKTNTSTTNLPSVITGSSKWGVLFYIAENGTTGTQMLYPIDGTYKGTIWTRSCVKQNFSPWKQLLTSDAISNGVKNPNAITFTGSSTGTYDGSAPLTINIPAGLSGDGSLQLTVATENTLGGVKAPVITEDMTLPVGIDTEGFLFTKPGKSWRLFKTITVPATAAEGADGVAWVDMENGGVLFAFDTDDDGNPFDFDDLFIEMKVGGITNGLTSANITGGNIPGYSPSGLTISIDKIPAEKLSQFAALLLKVESGKWVGFLTKNSGGAYYNASMSRAAMTTAGTTSWSSIKATLPYKLGYGYYQGSTFTFYGR